MKVFNNIEELKPYYNKETNTYEFVENGLRMDVEFNFYLSVDSHITAWNINAGNINAGNINAGNINVRNINAGDINARNINVRNINAGDINAGDINVRNINAGDIKAWDINAGDIKAWDISYHAVCFAYQDIECTSIKGRRENAKHFVLDGEITIKPKEQPKKTVTLELTDEQLEQIKEILK